MCGCNQNEEGGIGAKFVEKYLVVLGLSETE